MPDQIAAIINGETVTISLADAIAEYFRLTALQTERALDTRENRVRAALELTFGSLHTGDEARKLYEALTR